MAAPANPAKRYQTFLNSQESAYGGIEQLGTTGTWATPAADEPASNLPFDHRWRRLSIGGRREGAFTPGVVVTSGYMTTTAPVGGGKGRQFSTHFQFNPAEIDVAYTFDETVTGALNPAYIATTGGDPQGLMLNQSISFTLMFDRTYEVWTGPQGAGGASAAGVGGAALGQNIGYTAADGPYIYGVQWDVWSVERLVGIYGQASGKGPNGPPASSLCQIYFGQETTIQGTGPVQVTGSGSSSKYLSGRALGFTGWMTSLAVEYTRFDASMVPTRCAVALTFEQVYSVQAVYTNSSGQANDGVPSQIKTKGATNAARDLGIVKAHATGPAGSGAGRTSYFAG